MKTHNKYQERSVINMRKPLWTPSEERVKQVNITRFISLVNQKHRLEIDSYDQLYKWSVKDIPAFWAAMWEFGEIKASRRYDVVVDDLSKFPGAKWFVKTPTENRVIEVLKRAGGMKDKRLMVTIWLF